MSLTNIRRLARWVYGRLAYRNQISAYLRASEQPRLNLGCGQNILPGWMNVDLEGGRHGSIFMDATRPWPLPDNTFDAILCEHMIEHVPKDTGRHILSEGFRVLKPTARIRVVTPDLSSMAQLILDPMCPAFNSYLKFVAAFHSKSDISSGDAINYLFYHYGHRYIYTTAELRRHFEEVGFRQILETRAGHPLADIFRGAEGHPNFMGLENDSFEAFALEGIKLTDTPG
jgi:hypothetical protein